MGAERLNVVYARVSTDKQRKEGNLTRQVERLEQYARDHYPGESTVTIQETGVVSTTNAKALCV